MTTTKNKAVSFAKFNSWICGIPGDYYAIVVIAVVAYFTGYLLYPATPGIVNSDFMGWLDWSDQGMYLKSAKAIAHWKLSPETYVYPLGYPLLGAPFLKWLPRHPFLIPDLFFSAGIVLAFYASCQKFITRVESAALTLFLIILSAFTSTKAIAGGLVWSNSLIVPWNLIPVFFAAYLAVWLLVFNNANFHKLWIVSLAIALAFFARPPDVLFLGIIYLAGLVDLKSSKEKVQGIMILVFPSLLVLVIVLISKWVIFHNFLSPYDVTGRNIGFNLYDLPFKFYLIFFDGSPIYGYQELMLLPQMPWLLLCAPGIMLLAKYTHAKSWFLMAAIVVCLVIYISFNAQAPSSTFNYAGYRYFMWVFPWLGLCAYLTLTRSFVGVGKWKTITGILVGVLFALIIGWKETVVATISPTAKQSVGEVSQFYDLKARRFFSETSLPARTSVDGIKIVFSKLPTINMQVSSEWHNFSLIIDDKKQALYRDYNLYQSGNVAYVSFRNAINQTGQFQKARFQYDNTDHPVLDKVSIVKKEFKPFGFVVKVLTPLGIFPDEWKVSEDQAYDWGSIIAMGAGGNANPYKMAGWSGDERGYTWTEGHHALLGFKTPPVRAGLTMNLDAVGLDSPVPQTVEVEVNGRPLKKLILSSVRQAYDIDIPAEYLRPDGILLVQFGLPNAITPFELRMGQDKRVLAMAVFKLSLNPRHLR